VFIFWCHTFKLTFDKKNIKYANIKTAEIVCNQTFFVKMIDENNMLGKTSKPSFGLNI